MTTVTELHAHITWDTEPTEEAKNFVRLEVLKALQGTFQEGSWFSELVRTEVHKALQEGNKPQEERRYGRFFTGDDRAGSSHG